MKDLGLAKLNKFSERFQTFVVGEKKEKSAPKWDKHMFLQLSIDSILDLTNSQVFAKKP